MSRWILTLLLSLLLPAAWASTQRVALVVGNNAYAGLSPLVNAVADAELIASELQRAGFTVKLVRDANRRTLLREIREFSSRAEGGAEAVFYFAGHGIQVQSTNLLLPTDFQGRDDAEAHDEAVSLTWISNSLREAKARFSLLIIDACRNNPLPRSNGRTVGAERGLAPVSPAVGQMVIFSAGTGQEALDKLGRNDTNRNGLFVREFVRQMRRAGVPIDQMLRDVRDEVERQARPSSTRSGRRSTTSPRGSSTSSRRCRSRPRRWRRHPRRVRRWCRPRRPSWPPARPRPRPASRSRTSCGRR